MRRDVLIERTDFDVRDDVSCVIIIVVENVFNIVVDVSSIILSVRLKTAPSILQKNNMSVWYSTSMYTPFGRPNQINIKF